MECCWGTLLMGQSLKISRSLTLFFNPLSCLLLTIHHEAVRFSSVSRSSNNSNQNNSRRFISWGFTNHEPCAICLKNMNTKSFIAYKISIIACARALQLPFIRTSESGEINSQQTLKPINSRRVSFYWYGTCDFEGSQNYQKRFWSSCMSL